MNNAQKPCSHCSRATGGEYKYMTLAVVHPCCFVHNKQDNASPAFESWRTEKKHHAATEKRRGGNITVQHIIYCQNPAKSEMCEEQHSAHASQNRWRC